MSRALTEEMLQEAFDSLSKVTTVPDHIYVSANQFRIMARHFDSLEYWLKEYHIPAKTRRSNKKAKQAYEIKQSKLWKVLA